MTAIAKPQESVFDTAPEELRPVLESLVEAAKADSDWKTRKTTLLDALLVVETMTQLSPKQQAAFEELMAGIENGSLSEEEAKARMDSIEAETAEEDEGNEEFGSEAAEVIPVFIGAVLERLSEERITSAEQCALYILSIHPEHYEAAEDWLQADPQNTAAFKALLEADPRYAGLFDLILGEDEGDEFGDDEEA